MSKPAMALVAAAVCAGLAVAFFVGRAMATGAPTQSPLVFSGIVTDAAGVPYKTAQEVVVKFYDKADATVAKCTAPAVQAEANTGRFSVALPPECAQAVHDIPDLWTETVVAKTALPKVHIGAVPYALQADVAKIAAGVQCQGCVKVSALKFDQTVDLAGNSLTTGPGGAVLAAGKLDLGGGAALTGAQVKTLVGGGNADALHTHAGSGGGGGGQVIKFKGVTSVTSSGQVKSGSAYGLPAADDHCSNEYGAARMCTLEELEAIYPQPKPATKGWVHIFRSRVVSQTDRTFQAQTNYACGGYSSNYANSQGTLVDVNGMVSYDSCSKVYPILCCGP